MAPNPRRHPPGSLSARKRADFQLSQRFQRPTARYSGGEQRRTMSELVLRENGPGDIGWIVERHGALYWAEYGWDAEFEALVAEICAAFRGYDPARERCWIAELDGVRAGCVMCVRADESTVKLRLLLVEPFARGHGAGSALVDACTEF